ncbi:hypothetical protein [Pseudoalteromonas marina]|uniref:Uncharacterized protein n=1 Tax=Pseudoalteromonas marina TaxID=267375 RepID=A0ABT9FCE9_9GAMM|nr:hypothetical protein [Pseudoalteromonas marina]MDP2564408.1 hypothetical protein [Pseudoalteromonas marina]
MFQEFIPYTEQDRINQQAVFQSLFSMSFEDAKRAYPFKSVSYFNVSFKEFCDSKGVDLDYQSTVALNGVLAKVFLPCTRGSVSNYRGIKPGLKASALISEQKALYQQAIDNGSIIKVHSKRFCNYDTEQDLAFIRIRIRRSIKREMFLAKKENRDLVIHPDYQNSFFLGK